MGENYDRLASHPGGKDRFTPWKPEYVVWQFGLFGVLHWTRTVFFLPTALVLGELMDNMLHRFPFMEKAEIRQMINGPESFTPDGRYLLGEVPEVGLESNEHRSCLAGTHDLLLQVFRNRVRWKLL